MFNKIYNPKSKRMVNIKSQKGKHILHNYLNYSNQLIGGSQSKTDNDSADIQYPNLMELQQFIQMLKTQEDEILKKMYDDMSSECSEDPEKVITKYIADSKKSYYNGKYYLGGQIQLSPDDIITPEKIQEVKDIRLTRGGPTNSNELASMYRSKRELETMETIINHYIIIKTHIMFSPGGIGMKLAEEDFNSLITKGNNN
uniref:Uncharacterized protein n=1 Tax=viral metagenome TaxID=1070528 RepID=A0A6C0LX03_9ZZZZ